MTIAGIDYDSERVVIVIVDENTGRYLTEWTCDLACGPGDAFQRARRVRRLMPTRSAFEARGVTSVAIELPFSKYAASLVGHLRVQGAILACLPDDLDVVELRPQTWKRTTVGRSNASKADVHAWALEQGCPPAISEHHADAYAIARAHLSALDQRAAA